MAADDSLDHDGAAMLFVQFRDFWAEVEAVKAAVTSGAMDPARARNRLGDVLKAQSAAGPGSSTPPAAPEATREAQYAMAAAADDLFVQIPAARAEWALHPLELDLFGSRRAGQRIFEQIDRLLAGDHVLGRELAGIYLAALALGFKGMYTDRLDGDQKLAEYRERLRSCLGQTRLDGRVVPQCYQHTMALTPSGLLSGARAWWWAAAAVIGAWLAVSSLLWQQLSGGGQ